MKTYNIVSARGKEIFTTPVQGTLIKDFPFLPAFIHRDNKNVWTVSSLETGFRIYAAPSEKESKALTIAAARRKVEAVGQHAMELIKKNALETLSKSELAGKKIN